MTVWGCLDRPALRGGDYLNAICAADITLSINVCNDVRFYHSNRLTHLLGCRTFTLAKRVPDSELLFEDNKHVCYFDSVEHCVELVDRFGADPNARQRIGAAGMARAQEAFACEKLARHIIELIETEQYQETWAEIL